MTKEPTKDEIQKAVEDVIGVLGKGGTIRELKGIDDHQLEAVYAMGVAYYKAGNYTDAEKVFRFLVLFEHTSSKFWTGYGAVLQVQKRYAKALECYRMATLLDLHNPRPAYYAAECFLATNQLEFARQALATLEKYAADTEAGAKFRAKGAALKAKMEAAKAK